jgi:uroporphyrinogen-III synthase
MMGVRVAITRAQPDAERTAARVRAYGAEPVLAPLLTIIPRGFDTDCAGVQALMFTSANGVRAFAAASHERAVAALTVGEATAEAARGAGFSDVRSAQGDSSALAALALATLDPGGGRIVHVSGADIAGDLVAPLARAGFEAERRIAYSAEAAGELPCVFDDRLDMVLFHSARAGDIFARLGAPGAARLTAVCLSQAVADAAQNPPKGRITWKKIIVAPAPREADMLAAALSPTGASA